MKKIQLVVLTLIAVFTISTLGASNVLAQGEQKVDRQGHVIKEPKLRETPTPEPTPKEPKEPSGGCNGDKKK